MSIVWEKTVCSFSVPRLLPEVCALIFCILDSLLQGANKNICLADSEGGGAQNLVNIFFLEIRGVVFIFTFLFLSPCTVKFTLFPNYLLLLFCLFFNYNIFPKKILNNFLENVFKYIPLHKKQYFFFSPSRYLWQGSLQPPAHYTNRLHTIFARSNTNDIAFVNILFIKKIHNFSGRNLRNLVILLDLSTVFHVNMSTDKLQKV